MTTVCALLCLQHDMSFHWKRETIIICLKEGLNTVLTGILKKNITTVSPMVVVTQMFFFLNLQNIAWEQTLVGSTKQYELATDKQRTQI